MLQVKNQKCSLGQFLSHDLSDPMQGSIESYLKEQEKSKEQKDKPQIRFHDHRLDEFLILSA